MKQCSILAAPPLGPPAPDDPTTASVAAATASAAAHRPFVAFEEALPQSIISIMTAKTVLLHYVLLHADQHEEHARVVEAMLYFSSHFTNHSS